MVVFPPGFQFSEAAFSAFDLTRSNAGTHILVLEVTWEPLGTTLLDRFTITGVYFPDNTQFDGYVLQDLKVRAALDVKVREDQHHASRTGRGRRSFGRVYIMVKGLVGDLAGEGLMSFTSELGDPGKHAHDEDWVATLKGKDPKWWYSY